MKDILIGLALVALLVVCVVAGLYWLHTAPEPHTSPYDPRAFHCDRQMRLPCDGER